MSASDAESGAGGQPLVWLTTISVTINVIAAAVWLLESLLDCRRRRPRSEVQQKLKSRPSCGCRNAVVPITDCDTIGPAETEVVRHRHNSMCRAVDLVLSQGLALYALCILLRLPLLQQSFQPPTPIVQRFMVPALCVAVGRHVFFCVRGWRADRGAVGSLTHVVSAVCYLMFLHTQTTLVLAALSLATEVGSVYTQLVAIIGERRASRLPTWVPGLGVALSITFNGVVYLLVLALALARRSPMSMSPLAVSLFFFYITYSFIMNTYSIYSVIASLFGRVLEAKMACLLSRAQSKGAEGKKTRARGEAVPKQALSNIKTAMAMGSGIQCIGGRKEKEHKLADDVNSADNALLVVNMV